MWNIERGLEFDLIRLALSDPEEVERAANQRGTAGSSNATIDRQLRVLRDADIIILNEVGMKRIEYRDITKERSQGTRDELHFWRSNSSKWTGVALGPDAVKLEDPGQAERMRVELRVEPSRYLGVAMGNAILSRYPIEPARIVRLPVRHDWFAPSGPRSPRSKRAIVLLPTKSSSSASTDRSRRGRRMALIADVQVHRFAGRFSQRRGCPC